MKSPNNSKGRRKAVIIEKGVPLKCSDGSTHTLVFNMKAMVSLERLYADKETGEPLPFSKVALKLDPTNPSMDTISKFVWAALIHEDNELTPDDVLELINYDMTGVIYVFEQLDKAIALGLGINRDEILAEREKGETEGEVGKKLNGEKSKKLQSVSSV